MLPECDERNFIDQRLVRSSSRMWKYYGRQSIPFKGFNRHLLSSFSLRLIQCEFVDNILYLDLRVFEFLELNFIFQRRDISTEPNEDPMNINREKLDQKLCDASKRGDVSAVNNLIKKGASNWHGAIRAAIKGNHTGLVEIFIEKGATKLDEFMSRAAYNGNHEIVDLFIEKGVAAYEMGMTGASYGGHFNLIKRFIDMGATNWNNGLEYACLGGHKFIVYFFLKMGASEWGNAMAFARRGGHESLREFFERTRNDGGILDLQKFPSFTTSEMKGLEDCFVYSAMIGDEAVMRLCKEIGANNIESVFKSAATYGQLICMRICRNEWSAKGIDDAMNSAVIGIECEEAKRDVFKTCPTLTRSKVSKKMIRECIKTLSEWKVSDLDTVHIDSQDKLKLRQKELYEEQEYVMRFYEKMTFTTTPDSRFISDDLDRDSLSKVSD